MIDFFFLPVLRVSTSTLQQNIICIFPSTMAIPLVDPIVYPHLAFPPCLVISFQSPNGADTLCSTTGLACQKNR